MARGGQARQRYRRYRLNRRMVLAGIGVLSICAGIAIAAQIGAFYLHSSIAGGGLVRKERTAIAATAGNASACQALPDGARNGGQAATQPHGLLEAPSLGMVAPVLQGTGDSVLSEAVGHDPASVWPGQPGTSVLSAHDVTWFSRIGQLKPGNKISYVTPCRTYTYTVTSHVIVSAGASVYGNGTARLILDTCYPFDALYLTPNRYLVYATLSASFPTHPMAAVPTNWPTPTVPAPAKLAAQGLGLATNNAPLGTLHLTGSPSRAWAQSSAPFQFEAAALAGYFGLARSAAQEEPAWWKDLAPSLPASAAGPLWGGQITFYDSSMQITLHANGTKPASATLAATVTITGPEGTGSYDLTVGETVRSGKLYVTRVQASPAA